MKRWIIVAVGIVLALGVGAQPASANASRGYVDGAADQHDDWGDEATLSSGGPYWRSNYAALFQTILWADGFLTRSQVDCEFGSQTAAAARAWQATYNLPQTGQFDAASRTWADGFIVADGGEYFHYLGTGGRTIQFHRWSASASDPYKYDVNFFGEWRGSWYNTVNLSFCQ